MFWVQKQGFHLAKQSFAEITVFGIRTLCFWAENFAWGTTTLFMSRNKVLDSENFVSENLPIWLAIDVPAI